MILNLLQPTTGPTFAAKTGAHEKRCLKAMQEPESTGRASIFDLKIFEQRFATENNHLLCDLSSITLSRRQTIHNSISKICDHLS